MQKSKLNDTHMLTISGWIKDDRQLMIVQLTEKIKNELVLAVNKSTVKGY